MRVKSLKIIILIAVLWSGSLWALNVDPFRPAFDGDHHFLVYRSSTLPAGGWGAGYYINYAKRSLEVGEVGTLAGVSPVIDDLMTMGFMGAYGLTDQLSVGLSVPFSPFFTFQEIGSTVSENKMAVGDISLGAKFRFWSLESEKSEQDSWSVGAAVVPEISLPTGSNSKFLGDPKITGTLKGVLDFQYANTQISLNLGFRFREKEDFLNLSVGQEFVYGVGLSQEVWESQAVSVTSEFVGSTTLNGSPGSSNNIPMEWLLGADKAWTFETIPGKFSTSLGTGLGVTHGYGTPAFRVFGMLKYVWGD